MPDSFQLTFEFLPDPMTLHLTWVCSVTDDSKGIVAMGYGGTKAAAAGQALRSLADSLAR